MLELILYKCKIEITYLFLTEVLSTKVIVITVTTGGAAGFVFSWFSAGASLIAPPLLISILLIRSVTQQIANLRDYAKFKNLITKTSEDDRIKQTIQAVFMEGKIPKTNLIEMKALDLDKNPLPEFNFDLQSDQNFEEFIKAKKAIMEKQLGFVKNPPQKQL